MPKLWPVLSQGFTAVFTRLGIQAVPAGPQWWLSDTIVPMSLVDSDVTLQANVIERAEAPVSAGAQTAPVINFVLADTGALAAGNFKFRVLISLRDDVTVNQIGVQHRNAANAANIFEHQIIHGGNAAGAINFIFEMTLAMAANERLRVLNLIAGGGGQVYQATIFQTALP